MRASLLPLLFAVLWTSTLEAQTSTKVTDSEWRFGMNIGAAYQGKPIGENELDPAFGMGWGFTLGRMLYREPGDFFNVGLRGRFLWEMTQGISTERSYAIGVHPRKGNDKRFDLDVVGQRYQDSVGYVYSNYRQEGREYDLELTLGFNRWAERTNIYFYLFGGVGVINYQVHTDQLNSDGSVYRYDQKISGDPSKEELKELWDGDYETAVYEGGKIDRFIPSGGFGAIYQINRSLGIGFEHKISFPENEDRFDAKEFENGFDPASHPGGEAAAYDEFRKTPRQDLYHYTSISFRWRILSDRGDEEEKEEEPSADSYTDYEEDENVTHAEPPEVEIVDPPQDPHTTTRDSVDIEARIRHVGQEENVTLLIDGQEFGDPDLDLSSNTLEQRIAISKGEHQVRVEGVNDRGRDADGVRIIRKSEEKTPPRVRISEPSSDPFRTNDPREPLEATVLNVTKKDSVDLRFNGKQHPFDFDPSSGVVKADLDLIQGANRVEIEAWNEAGRDSDERTLIFKKEDELDPPKVWVRYPDNDPHVVDRPSSKVTARIEGIASRHDITVTQNGRSINDFNYYPQSGLLTMRRDLDVGNNRIRIRVSDRGGSDEAEQRIIRRSEQGPPPKVNFIRPASSGTVVNSPQHRIEAELEHVSDRSRLVFEMNGSERKGFAFDPSSGKLLYDATLRRGSNEFRIRAKNAEGSDQASRTIRYQKDASGSGNAPSIQVISPGKDPSTVQKRKASVDAAVRNVADKSGLRVLLNGKPVSSYKYDPGKGSLSLTEKLVEGRNHFAFVATNDHGLDKASQTIIYEPQDPPTVNIIDPSGKKTVHSSSYSVRGKVLRVSDASDLSFQVNGNDVNTFSYDPNSGHFKGKVSLGKGNNEVELKGKNPHGSDRDRVKIRYEKPDPPTVSITKPSSQPHKTSKKKVLIKGKVNGIDGKEELSIMDNGNSVSNFKFLKTGYFKYMMKMKDGRNKVRVRAKNSAGQDSDDRVIIRSGSSKSLKDRKGGKEESEAEPDKRVDPGGSDKKKEKEPASKDEKETAPEPDPEDPDEKGGSDNGGQIQKKKGQKEKPDKGDKGDDDSGPTREKKKKGKQIDKDKR